MPDSARRLDQASALIRRLSSSSVSFDLAVLAAASPLAVEEARRMFEGCVGGQAHRDGDLDPRIVTFYQELTQRFPDHRPYDAAASPWASTPLNIGIDHVIMNISYGARGAAAIEAVRELADDHQLVGVTHLPRPAQAC
jgi:hypothetical protein